LKQGSRKPGPGQQRPTWWKKERGGGEGSIQADHLFHPCNSPPTMHYSYLPSPQKAPPTPSRRHQTHGFLQQHPFLTCLALAAASSGLYTLDLRMISVTLKDFRLLIGLPNHKPHCSLDTAPGFGALNSNLMPSKDTQLSTFCDNILHHWRPPPVDVEITTRDGSGTPASAPFKMAELVTLTYVSARGRQCCSYYPRHEPEARDNVDTREALVHSLFISRREWVSALSIWEKMLSGQ